MSPTNGKTTSHRVLIVDDEESMRLFLAHVLTTGLNAEVTLAGTCEQALRLAGNNAYDAILLDLLMPGVGGFEVLAGIRRALGDPAAARVAAQARKEASGRSWRERTRRMLEGL